MTLEEKFKDFREDGYKEGIIEMCKNMLSEDLPISQISRISGLSEAEILKIKKEIAK